jgi:hypothetical protein
MPRMEADAENLPLQEAGAATVKKMIKIQVSR